MNKAYKQKTVARTSNTGKERGMGEFFKVVMALLSVSAWSVCWAGLSVSDITEKMMLNIHPNRSTSFKVEVFICQSTTTPCEAEQGGEQLTRLNVYVSLVNSEQSEPVNTLIEFLYPEGIRGQLILHEQKRIWMYFPGTQNPIRIPPAQNILGDVDVGSILDIDYRRNYQPRLLEDNDKELPGTYKVEYVDNSGDMQYYRVDLWIDKELLVPRRAYYYSESGMLLRKSEFRDIGKLGSRRTYRRVDTSSMQRGKNRYTSIIYVSEPGVQLPVSFFRSNRLKSFRGLASDG